MEIERVSVECAGGPRDGEFVMMMKLKNPPPGAIETFNDPSWDAEGWHGEYELRASENGNLLHWNVITR